MSRVAGSAGGTPQMADARPAVSAADGFVLPQRQASLSHSASMTSISSADGAADFPARSTAGSAAPVSAAPHSASYAPMPRTDSLLTAEQASVRQSMAAEAMGIDLTRASMVKEGVVGSRPAGAPEMQRVTSANIEQALFHVASPVGGNFTSSELMPGTSMPALRIDATPSSGGGSNSDKTPVSTSSQGSGSSTGLRRRQTHAKAERRHPRYLLRGAGDGEIDSPLEAHSKRACGCQCKPWTCYYRFITLCCPSACLSKCGGMHDVRMQNAWREKIGLVSIILILCAALGFLTFGFVKVACNRADRGGAYDSKANIALDGDHRYIIHGNVYNYGPFIEKHVAMPQFAALGNTTVWAIGNATGQDISALFPKANSTCSKVAVLPITIQCTANEFFLPPTAKYCHKYEESQAVLATLKTGWISYEWNNINRPLMVYNSRVLNMRDYLSKGQKFLGDWAHQIILANLGGDATIAFSAKENAKDIADCLVDLYTVGYVTSDTIGCIATDIVLNVSLVVILGVVLVRFFMALAFDWLISWRLGQIQDKAHLEELEKRRKERRCGCCRRSDVDKYRSAEDYLAQGGAGGRGYQFGTSTQNSPIPSRSHSRRNSMSSISSEMLDAAAALPGTVDDQQYAYGVPSAAIKRMSRMSIASVDSTNSMREKHHDIVLMAKEEQPPEPFVADDTFMLSQEYREYGEIYTVMLVTTYSEGEESCRTTLDSLAKTTYDDQYKMLFIVSDGIITGSGNEKSTPQILIDMMELDPHLPNPPVPQSYIAIADGSKKHNMAQVFAGHYVAGSHRVPTILVVKCGTPEEQAGPKPGNRGKRDSQVILMSFFQKVTFDDRMSPLEFDIFNKMRYLTGVPPDRFEIVLMVDADTKVAPDALSRMVAVMGRDHGIIGLCGETRIGNKADSWVTRIQVFEYYISHHLTKAFESMFGGVTCLPGCFCMWRIKVPKGDGLWVPVVCNPDILAEYSQSQVDTLHEKNLLLLGEDRFLTTLMLKTFPKRKLIFVPKAYCKTTVPDRFRVLLSQRRRWINSTVHNLMELVLVRELCGTFCFSMQFVVFMELVGTVVLPAAITFTGVLIGSSVYSGLTGGTIEIIPLLLLFAILGLPAFLILLQAKRVVYVYWMMLYLIALPIWNFILPAYAFWHFDDFSWGSTRLVAGEQQSKDGHSSDGKAFDTNVVPHKKWSDWERERRRVLIKDWDLPVERTASIGALAVQKWVKQQQELEEGGQRIGDIVVPIKPMMSMDSARPKTMYR